MPSKAAKKGRKEAKFTTPQERAPKKNLNHKRNPKIDYKIKNSR